MPRVMSLRDRIQLGMFKSIFISSRDLTVEERFAAAVVKSSDTAYEESIALRPEAVKAYAKYLDEMEAHKMNGGKGKRMPDFRNRTEGREHRWNRTCKKKKGEAT